MDGLFKHTDVYLNLMNKLIGPSVYNVDNVIWLCHQLRVLHCVLTGASGWWVAGTSMKAEWRCAIIVAGVEFVMTGGTAGMPAWSATSSTSLVCSCI